MRSIIRPATLLLTLMVGLAGNSVVDSAGALVVERLFGPEPSLAERSVAMLVEEPKWDPEVAHCGLLLVVVGDHRELYLRREPMGSLGDPGLLLARLHGIFEERTLNRAYRADRENSSELSLDERIDKTVLIKAPRSLTYGELDDLIVALKASGANAIGLMSEHNYHPQRSVDVSN